MSVSTRAAWLLGGLSLATGAALAAGESGDALAVRLDGERLSLHVERMPLGELLAALERSGRVRVGIHGDLSGVTVSDSFNDADVAQALRRVLSGHSHMLIDHGATQHGRRDIELILLGSRGVAGPEPRSDPGRFAPADESDGSPEAQPTAEALLNIALSAASAEERAAAGEALAYQDDSAGAGYAGDVLVQQLSDPEEQVRARALETLKDTAEEVPVDALEQVARDDVSAERRVQALELLAERTGPKARAPLRRALADTAPEVSARARELIEDWHLDGR
jgi:hypothetical protein